MKKTIFTTAILIATTLNSLAQLIEVTNFNDGTNYKKHYSHTIEGGTVEGRPREFVVGNHTDYLPSNNTISGQSVEGNIVYPGKWVRVIPTGVPKIQLADFTIIPTADYEYAAGTGIYYPESADGLGYVYLGIYNRRTMDLLYLYTYDLLYSGGTSREKNTAGLRIKFSELENSFYICGVMAENVFRDMNINSIDGGTQGFILKINFTNPTSGNAILFNPEVIPTYPDSALLCAVTDLEIDDKNKQIIFTGINTKAAADGYYCPFAGKVGMDLSFQWARAYPFDKDRFSGVDVEYGSDGNFYVLLNSNKSKFAVMELDNNGIIIQQPVTYEFSYQGTLGLARSHVLHYNYSNLLITGNFFYAERDQHLFSYDILDANNLLSGDVRFKSYAVYPVPVGKQEEVTSYWAPENSILSDSNLSIVGIYQELGTIPPKFGYCLVHTQGYDYDKCLQTGEAEPVQGTSNPLNCQSESRLTTGSTRQFFVDTEQIEINQLCVVHEKSGLIDNPELNGFTWEIERIFAEGIAVEFISEETSTFDVSIYDVTGRKVYSDQVTTKGQKVISFNFKPESQMYLINITNGSYSETKKVAFIK